MRSCGHRNVEDAWALARPGTVDAEPRSASARAFPWTHAWEDDKVAPACLALCSRTRRFQEPLCPHVICHNCVQALVEQRGFRRVLQVLLGGLSHWTPDERRRSPSQEKYTHGRRACTSAPSHGITDAWLPGGPGPAQMIGAGSGGLLQGDRDLGSHAHGVPQGPHFPDGRAVPLKLA